MNLVRKLNFKSERTPASFYIITIVKGCIDMLLQQYCRRTGIHCHNITYVYTQ